MNFPHGFLSATAVITLLLVSFLKVAFVLHVIVSGVHACFNKALPLSMWLFVCTYVTCWRRDSVAETSVCGWRTYPDLCLIYGWQVTTSLVKCPLWVSQPGKLSFPSLRCRLMSSYPCNFTGRRTSNGRPGLHRMFGCKVRGRGLGPLPICCTPVLSVIKKAPLQLQYSACGAI